VALTVFKSVSVFPLISRLIAMIVVSFVIECYECNFGSLDWMKWIDVCRCLDSNANCNRKTNEGFWT
jgi:hypothetical protein